MTNALKTHGGVMRRRIGNIALAGLLAGGCGAARADDDGVLLPVQTLPTVTVVAMTPLPGSGIDIDKVPSNVLSLGPASLRQDHALPTLAEAAARRAASVALSSQQGSEYQPDFSYRGFDASPIAGVAQGLAVYQNGARINEAFGDTVNWDLLPEAAVQRITVQGNNTVFGLNALGGAVSLEMKNGFSASGRQLQLRGGSHGNLAAAAEFAGRDGDAAYYLAVDAMRDRGYRNHSDSRLRRAYADFGVERERIAAHLSLTLADNPLAGVGPTPLQMLQADRRAVFTWPQRKHNQLAMLQLNTQVQWTDTLALSANLYLRQFRQHLTDGNTTDVVVCQNDAGHFCLQGNDSYPGDALYDSNGQPVPTSALPPGATPGEIDRTRNRSLGIGAALQATATAPLWGRDNHFSTGLSYDHGAVRYGAYGELSSIAPDLRVDGAGVVIDQFYNPSAQPPLAQPVDLRVVTRYGGLYLTDTLDLTPRLSWTLNARYNLARLSLRDQLGRGLDADHVFSHFNPGSGFTYKLGAATTAYLGYAQSNRAPTAGELSCADPERPCLLEAFLVSDPPLKQVVAQSWEAGQRGQFKGGAMPGALRWQFGLFRVDNRDDILLVASPINGFGYFVNAGGTRRQGAEASLNYRLSRWTLDLSLSLIDATFRQSQTLASNSPSADANGNIQVNRGDRLPLTPRGRATLNLDYAAGDHWQLGAGLRADGPQYLAGDAANQQAPLPGYARVDLHGAWRLRPQLEVFAQVDNLFDRDYATFGNFASLDGLPPNFGGLTERRAYSPAPGRSVYVGLKLNF